MNLIAFSFDDSISWMTASILSSLLCSYSGIITSLPLLFFLLINRWLVVAFSLQGRCSPFSQPLSAKLVLFFSNNNGFMLLKNVKIKGRLCQIANYLFQLSQTILMKSAGVITRGDVG